MKNLIITVSLAFFLFGLVPHAEAFNSGSKFAPRAFVSKKSFQPRRFQGRKFRSNFTSNRKFHSGKVFYKPFSGRRSLNISRGSRIQIVKRFTLKKFVLPTFQSRVGRTQFNGRLAAKLRNRIR